MKSKVKPPVAEVFEGYDPLDASDVVHVAGGIWAVLDGSERFFANIATEVCTCRKDACEHLPRATEERNRFQSIGFTTEIPDSDRLALLAIRRGLQIAVVKRFP